MKHKEGNALFNSTDISHDLRSLGQNILVISVILNHLGYGRKEGNALFNSADISHDLRSLGQNILVISV